MRVAPPDLPRNLETAVPLHEALSLCAAYDMPLEGYAFHGEDISGVQLQGFEARGCAFTGCRFTGALLQSAAFRSCTFTNCDFAGVRATESGFTQCAFVGCKLTGASFAAAGWNDVTAANCMADDAVWAEALLRNVSFTETTVRRAVFSDLRPRSAFVFTQCDLRTAEFCHTPLKGQNLTTCDIDGIIVTDGVLQGARVTAVQACELARLLGVVIE